MGASMGVISKGTVIATMVDGHYPNHAHGNHAAIYLSHDVHGIVVLDQWTGHPVSRRTIHPHGGHANASNDADAFYVLEEAPPAPAPPVPHGGSAAAPGPPRT